MQILRRKLAAAELKYGKSDFERRHYALFGLMCIYGIELLPDNIVECRANLLDIFAEYLNLEPSDDLYRAAFYVLSQNLVHGDALTLRAQGNRPITFAEWGYLGKGRFQRRDFRYDSLTQSSAYSAEGSLFAHLGKHEIFTPAKTYPPMTVGELAAVAPDAAEVSLSNRRTAPRAKANPLPATAPKRIPPAPSFALRRRNTSPLRPPVVRVASKPFTPMKMSGSPRR